MTDTTNAPAPTVWPTLQAHDARALIDFLVDVVGFEKTAVYADGDRVAHAQLDWPAGGGIMLGSHQANATWSREPGTAGTYLVTDEVDLTHQRAVAAGATIVAEPVDRDHGGREFTLADPEGNLWSIGSYRGEPRRDA
ncbi:VOC family protein [Microlunatus speluncae]|uniref:VOC family protein n=1 Tax=Microlunatus speluncae TaxID=2594267 RepID=UPI0012666634|nr:VOC family protein [Microlunatus speluncae]